MIKWKLLLLSLLLLSLLPRPVRAEMVMGVTDEFDHLRVVEAARAKIPVARLDRQIQSFEARLTLLKQRDFIALFGHATAMPARTYALPCSEPRSVMLSGLRSLDPAFNRQHEEFYKVGSSAGLRVFYGADGQSPETMLLYFRVDKGFARLRSVRDLNRRLIWDTRHLNQLRRFYAQRRKAVFVWEVDVAALSRWSSGLYARDCRAKLKAWLDFGPTQGWRLDKEKPDAAAPSFSWRWFRRDNSVAREATFYPGESTPFSFSWVERDQSARIETAWGEVRREINNIQWERPAWKGRLREEALSRARESEPLLTHNWTWEDGKRIVRLEWDDNGDGIPDWFSPQWTQPDRPQAPAQRLDLARSWAIHPQLIPPQCRIPDQPDRRVPLRKIR